MKLAIRPLFCSFFGLTLLIFYTHNSLAQEVKPGLSGMAPSRWIRIEHSQAPNRTYGSANSPAKKYTQEDLFVKMWVPVLHKSRYSVLLGPQYRMEQLEFEDKGENPMPSLDHWNLRSLAVDVMSSVRLDSSSWLIVNLKVHQSGNQMKGLNASVPLSYTFTSVFLRKKSLHKEIGVGLMVNRSFHSLVVLPVVGFNYNYSPKAGVEINLPYKISWRYNSTPKDIFFVKAQAMTRGYFIASSSAEYTFRRTEIDMGVAYNRQLSKLFGAELFLGYRRNLSTHLPDNFSTINNSGLVFSLDFYVKSPLK